MQFLTPSREIRLMGSIQAYKESLEGKAADLDELIAETKEKLA